MIAVSNVDIAQGRIPRRFRVYRERRLRLRYPGNRILLASGIAERSRRTGMPLPEFKQIVDEARSQIQEIGPSDLLRMRQAGEDFTLIDVREPDEHAKGMIAGAVAMPRGILERDIDKITTKKDRKIVLYC